MLAFVALKSYAYFMSIIIIIKFTFDILQINEKFERFDEFIVAKFASSTKIIDEAEEKHVKQV
jgi:hypothetical protein